MKQKRTLSHGPIDSRRFSRYTLFGRKLMIAIQNYNPDTGQYDPEEKFDTGMLVPGLKRKTKEGKEILVYKRIYRDRNKYNSDGTLRKAA